VPKKYLALILFASSLTAQTTLDSVQLKKIKEEIKTELRQEMSASQTQKKPVLNLNGFTLNGYGIMNYYHYKYDTDRNLKDKLDAERLNFYIGYKYNDWLSFQSEIEFEHGGTGATLELDTQEEFGEYEQEIESGGEVKFEQAYLDFRVAPNAHIRAGRLKLYVGIAQTLDDPDDYFTTYRPEMENEILPLGWYENGVEFTGSFWKNRLLYHVAVTNGLDASGFSSRSWIKYGYQQRFEMVNAEAFAFMGRLDYKFGYGDQNFFGVSAYVNDAAANRPKNDMKESAYVKIVEAHVVYNMHFWRFNAIGLFGDLENSDIVSRKNASLSNTLGVKRTPVGKQAVGVSAEVGYDIMHLISPKSIQMLYPFARYDYYDTMHAVEGSVIDNPRWERSVITGGVNWSVIPSVIIKAQYASRRLGSQDIDPGTLQYTGHRQRENTFSMGVSYIF